MDNNLKWYALYTRPRWEKKVAALLCERKIENYCPLQKVERTWSDRKKIVYEPLFKSYVLVRITAKTQVPVLQTDGVLSFVTFQAKPAVVRDAEIAVIKQFLKDYQQVQVEKIDLNVNDAVTILNGPLTRQKGQVLEIKNKTVKVLLPSLGFALVAVGKDNLAKGAGIN